MKEYAALMRLQLLSRYADYKPEHIREQLKEKDRKKLWRLFGAVILIIYLLVILITVENALLKALIPMGLADLLMSLAVGMGVLGTLVMAFFFVMSALYFNRDAVQLASLPIRTRTLLSARLTQVWVSETMVNAMILLPAGILYGIRTGVDGLYYVRLAVVWLTLSILPIMIVSWISTLLIRLSALWKRREMIATVSGIILLIAYMIFCFNMGSIMGGDEEASEMVARFLASQQGRIESMFVFFPPLRWAVKGLMGDGGQLLLFAAVSLAAAALTVLGIGTVYRRLSLLQGETNAEPIRKVRSSNAYGSSSVLAACCRREWKSIARVSTYAVNTFPTAFMPVFMIVAMYFGIVRGGGLDTASLAEAANQFPQALIVGIMTAVMAYMMGINPAAATAVTREGRGHDLYKSLPIDPAVNVQAKLLVTFGISVAGALAGTIALMILLPMFVPHALMAFVLCVMFGFATTALSLGRDVRHPRLDWVTEQEAIKQSSGSLMGLLISWGLLVALGIISYFLIAANMSMYLYVLIMAVILAVICWLSYRKLIKSAEEMAVREA